MWFVLLCLFFRAAIPLGYMPSPSGTNSETMFGLCHGDAASAELMSVLEKGKLNSASDVGMELPSPESNGDQSTPHHAEHFPICAYSLFPQFALIASVVVLELSPFTFFPPRIYSFSISSLFRGVFSARAPPVTHRLF